MALLQKLYHLKKDTPPSVHDPIRGDYFVFEENGSKYLQINTYGSADREFPDKVSQSIQFSEDAIKQLRKIIDKM